MPGEKKLGGEICSVIRELTPHIPYYAEYQNSLDSLTVNILGSLDRAVGLVAVMHPRGIVEGLNESRTIRASVWIEQEIAIAAYISQIFRRPFKTAVYVHESIQLEGMRQQLHLNPPRFTENQQILDHLRSVLPSWGEIPLEARPPDKPTIDVELQNGAISNFLLKYSNDGAEDVSIDAVRLSLDGQLLTGTIKPDTPGSWLVPAGAARSFGKSITSQRDPAETILKLRRAMPGQSVSEAVIVGLRCSVRGERFEIFTTMFVYYGGADRQLHSQV